MFIVVKKHNLDERRGILKFLQEEEKLPRMTREEIAVLVVLVIGIVVVVSFVVGTQILLGEGMPQKRTVGGSFGGGDDRQYSSNAYPCQFSYPNSRNSGP